MRNVRGALAVCLLSGSLLGARAEAIGWSSSSITMRTVDNVGGSATGKYEFDQAMIMDEPVCNGPEIECVALWTQQNRLVVFLHGHGANDGPDGTEFIQAAAGAGFHAISFDYDYGNDKNLTSPPDNMTNAPRHICGCYSECYEQLHDVILNGGSPGGLPPSLYPLTTRIKHVISYLSSQRDGVGGDWGQYVVSGNIQWNKIVLVGFSRGSSLVTVLAKDHLVNRVLTFSGVHDQLINGDEKGTNGTATGPDTTYRFGLHANDGKACAYPTNGAFSPKYITQINSQNGWQTQLGAMYTFSNVDDDKAPYLDPTFSFGTEVDLVTEGFGSSENVGNYVYGENTFFGGWESNSPHWLVSAPLFGVGPGNICDPYNRDGTMVDPHDTAIGGDCLHGTAQDLRTKVWLYMLTH